MDPEPTTDPAAAEHPAASADEPVVGGPEDDLDVPADWAERTDDDPAAVAAMREERASRRLRQTIRDMLISMLVVSGAVVLLVAPWNRSAPDPVRVVDPTTVVAGARATEPWPVLAPTGTPATWRCTIARILTAGDGQDVVHLAYLTPGTTSVGLDQSATRELTFVSEQTVGGRPAGSAVIGGATWQKLESADGSRRSYVRQADGATYVVSGGASWADLTTFTASLVPG
ncbi:MAG TPA: DUF4245 domain-containing protein [Candidatus Angelobacter sp.]|nr:DUF4245 domain-containing protein [Candidatus Angelobacter sp.]